MLESLAAAEKTPLHRLLTCLAVIRGGRNVPEEKIEADLDEWIERYGFPTKESVEKWADESFELRFALDCQINGEPK